MPQPLHRSELKENLRRLRQRLLSRPMDLDARVRMARTHRVLREKKKAIAHYDSVARYLAQAGRPLQAIATLKELLEVDPDHQESLMFLAKIYARASTANPKGRIALPIQADDEERAAPSDPFPTSDTAIWRAIRPTPTEMLSVIHDADDVGAVPIAYDIHDEATHPGDQLLSGVVDISDEKALADLAGERLHPVLGRRAFSPAA